MNETQHYSNGNSFRSLSTERSTVFQAKISIDLHDQTSAAGAAVALAYQEMILAGAGRYDREGFLDAINRLGADISVSESMGIITFTLRAQAEKAAALIKLFSIMMREPQFSAKELKRVKKILTNELTDLLEDARSIAEIHLLDQLYLQTDRHYRPLPNHIKAAVQQITVKDLRQYHNAIQEPLWCVTATGSSDILRQFTKTITALHKQELAARVGIDRQHGALQPTRRLHLTDIPSKQNIEFSLGAGLPLTIHHPDFAPFLFGLTVLGKWGGFSGRLMSTVREKEGLTYGIYARTEGVMGNETGHWRIMTFFSPADAEKGLRSTLREVKKIAQAGITNDELLRFKTILRTQQTLLNDSYTRRTEESHNYHLLGMSIEETKGFKDRLLSVTRSEVNNALKKYLRTEEIVISGAGPVKKVDLSTFTDSK